MKKGFTLIELMVSVTIFIIVMVISLGALLSISAAERKAEALKTVMNNLNFGLESMARSIRTGVTYHCGESGVLEEPLDCTNGDDYFAFEGVNGDVDDSTDQIVYQLTTSDSDDDLCGQVAGSVGCILRSTNSGGNFSSITAPEVQVTTLTFYVVGSVPEFQNDPESAQPKVVISMSGQVLIGLQPTTFNLQTTVTQRLYDQ